MNNRISLRQLTEQIIDAENPLRVALLDRLKAPKPDTPIDILRAIISLLDGDGVSEEWPELKTPVEIGSAILERESS